MNPTVYQVERNGQFTTVKSFNDHVGVVRGLFRIPGRYIPWERLNDRVTMVAGNIRVTIVDLPLSWVKWCPTSN